jgi:replicative DNA helicase
MAKPRKQIYGENAERATLGAVLGNPASFIIMSDFLRSEDFFLLRHQYIYAAFTSLSARREVIDFTNVIGELETNGQLEDVGGIEYLAQLLGTATDCEKAEYYARHVQRLALRRRVATVSADLYRQAYDTSVEFSNLLAQWDKASMEVRGRSLMSKSKTFKQLVGEYFDRVEMLMTNPQRLLGIPTGLRELDALISGLQKTDLIVLAGRPGMGKTAMLGQIALNTSRLNARVGIFSMEMSEEQIVNRLISTDTGIDSQRLRTGALEQNEWSAFTKSTGRLAELSIYIDDRPALTPQQIRSKCYEWMSDGGLDLVLVDYIQKMSDGGMYKADRVQSVGYFARSLKDLAKELRVPVLAAAQLSRSVEQRQDKHPQLSDLRESGEIEQEADIVAFLYRDAYYNQNTEFPNRADLEIAKHRNGPTGMLTFHFDKHATRFHDAHTQTIDLRELSS